MKTLKEMIAAMSSGKTITHKQGLVEYSFMEGSILMGKKSVIVAVRDKDGKPMLDKSGSVKTEQIDNAIETHYLDIRDDVVAGLYAIKDGAPAKVKKAKPRPPESTGENKESEVTS